ncbi:MAG: hypothetical protein OEZ38_04200 [Gammaproteobacteria bacterium]|nr:hypothetical protein [Gammaproteobacteria bacterium]
MVVTRLLMPVLLVLSFSVFAANPFKKSVDFEFPDNINWVLKKDAVVKTGRVMDGSDALFFHLSISDKQLKLRFSKNDPTGTVINSRSLSSLVIDDVLVDGQRLPLFQWCLNNQQLESSKFKQDTPVNKDACINRDGDFIINLNEQSAQLLIKAQTLEFVTEPFRRTEILNFGMKGYGPLAMKLKKPVAAPVVKVVPKAVPKQVVEKICYVKAPAQYKAIKPAGYPCSDKAKKAGAEAIINKLVLSEKKKAEIEAEEAKQKQESKIDLAAEARAEAEFEKRQAAIWIKRCQKHWSKGVSPCYCKKYAENAPQGVKDTCPAK